MSAIAYRSIPLADVVVGDVYANHGTVTSVVHGPRTAAQCPDPWLRPGRGETVIQVGPGLSLKTKSKRLVVIGRAEWADVS